MKKNIWVKQPWEHFDYCWQAEIDKDIYVNVVYIGFLTYEMRILIPKDKSVTGIELSIVCFYYDKEDFDKWEKDAKKLINNLIK